MANPASTTSQYLQSNILFIELYATGRRVTFQKYRIIYNKIGINRFPICL